MNTITPTVRPAAARPAGHDAAAAAGAGAAGGRGGGPSFEEVREQARQLVSIAFVQPMLEEVRRSSMAAGPFAAGDVEKHFGPLLDQHLASSFGNTGRHPLVDAVARKLAAPAVQPAVTSRGSFELEPQASTSTRELLPLRHDPMEREAMALSSSASWRERGAIDLERTRLLSLEAYR